jgi:hypothetical protein
VRSVSQRLRNTFGVAVAEVADNDAWQIARIGVACVANSASHCERVVDEVIAFVQDSRLDAEVIAVDREVIAMGED